MSSTSSNIFSALWKFKGFRIACALVIILAILSGVTIYVYTRVLSSENIDNPQVEHLHFRMQYVYHGDEINLSDSRFQQPYEKNQCAGGITDSPVHLHDNLDQIVHIHWKNVTGGQVLKYYGVNYIGGLDNVLGYRFDEFKLPQPEIKQVSVFGQLLPKPKKDDQLFVYNGDQNTFSKRSAQDWLNQSLESFFNKKSLLSFANILSPVEVLAQETDSKLDKPVTVVTDPNTKVYAQGTANEPTEEELKEINNLIGNVVIFVQKDRPTDDQVRARFDNLEPLSLSTCGG